MSKLLPLQTMESVKDLTLNLVYMGDEQQWTEFWDRLTSITRLVMNWHLPQPGEVYFLPAIMIESLLNVEIIVRYYQFNQLGEEFLEFFIACFPLLSKLQVTIEGLTVPNNARYPGAEEEAGLERERLKAICMAVQSSISGLECNILEVEGGVARLQLESDLQS